MTPQSTTNNSQELSNIKHTITDFVTMNTLRYCPSYTYQKVIGAQWQVILANRMAVNWNYENDKHAKNDLEDLFTIQNSCDLY